MGRPVMTKEMRVAKVPEETRVKLLVLLSNRETAREQAEKSEVELRTAIAEVVSQGDVSFRDVASTLDIPHQSVHGWIKRHAGS